MSDPGSLQNLNDIVVPAPVAWWPPAPGWYVVLAVFAMALAWAAFRGLKAWRRNTYRRQALRELKTVAEKGAPAAADIPVLLKRAALSAWPRQEVAMLTGKEWHAFLDRTGDMDRFRDGGAGALMDRLSYGSSPEQLALTSEEFIGLNEAARAWLRQHRTEAATP